jgi:F-type H+-transporting ATPase subunit delta
MNEGKISVRYAQALYALAEEQGVQKDIYTRMEALSEAFIQVPGFAATLSNPMQPAINKLSLLLTATGCASESLLASFFRFIAKKGREEYMVFMAMSYQKVYREKQRIVMGKITSAVSLEAGTADKIRKLVDQRFSASMELSTKVEPDILGGFILEVDNYQMDSSLRTKLESVRSKLMHD